MENITEENENKKSNDFYLLKEEVNDFLHELEKKLTGRLNQAEIKSKQDFDNLSNKMDSILKANGDMIESVVTQKFKLDKITEFEAFRNKVDNIIITHEIRLKNTLEDISKMQSKYDKMLTENLYVPGYIGIGCQYKNLCDYIQYNINEVGKMRNEKELMKKDLKELKNRFENLNKHMSTLNETTIKFCNKYTDSKQSEFERMLNETKDSMNQKSFEMRTVLLQFKDDASKNEKKTRDEFEKFLNMKEEFIQMFNNKIEEFKKLCENMDAKIINSKFDIGLNKDRILNLDNQLKGASQTINDLSFQIRNITSMNNKIYSRMDKIENINNCNSFTSASNVMIKNSLNKDLNKFKSDIMINKAIENQKVFLINKSMRTNQPISDKGQPNKLLFSVRPNREYSLIRKKEKENSDSEKSNIILDSKEEIKFKENKEDKMILDDKVNMQNTPKLFSSKLKIDANQKVNNLPLLTLNNINLQTHNHIGESKTITNTEINNIQSKVDKPTIDKSSIENDKQNNILKKQNILNLIINNDNELKMLNQKQECMTIIEPELQDCNIVNLSLEHETISDHFKFQPKKGLTKKLREESINLLINTYKAKLIKKQKTPDEKMAINKEIIEMPNKITQAFGRTTYKFYFKKKDHSLNTKNIKNHFGNIFQS